MNLHDRMAHLTSRQLLSSARFGEEVKFYKGEDVASEQTVNVIWDADSMFGTNEVDGDGVVLDKRSGRRTRQSIYIECPSSLDVDEHADPPDRFVRGSEVVLVKRIMARDTAGMMLVLGIRTRGKYDRGKHRIG